MKTKNTLITTAVTIFSSIGLHALSINIDTVAIGNAGNAAENRTNYHQPKT
jgi:hypothetical protein